jgi:hypothetical protein
MVFPDKIFNIMYTATCLFNAVLGPYGQAAPYFFKAVNARVKFDAGLKMW